MSHIMVSMIGDGMEVIFSIQDIFRASFIF